MTCDRNWANLNSAVQYSRPVVVSFANTEEHLHDITYQTLDKVKVKYKDRLCVIIINEQHMNIFP
jgi:hypothetical protein